MRNELGSWRRRDYGLRKKDSWLMVVDAHWQWRRSYVIIEGARQMEEANYWNWRLSQ